ncbi:zinc/iron-chelating domain-containing protein [Luteimonas chenhongjianii]|uniref:Zinc/iron-chelating domain-containing protein n=1 Tax=Luteimonas chenhongjianii TaxID=2006110 RepID=A0A290XCB5_9GAMM|nr:YkgJ family cysteine cluster protein [Luteimonas chenhongjianii]ATD66596.1 zinc/iron-chelating domain-containing protein [Luteimonas chenhongjianii]
MRHPCLSCGACCAHYRVSMHWMETDAGGGVVPLASTEPFGGHQVAMRGTWEAQPRCVALDARIGQYSRCTIHPRRPTACRDVAASWENGAASPQCDRARLAHGLPALTAADWALVYVVHVDAISTGDEPPFESLASAHHAPARA